MDKEQMAKPPEPWEFRSKPAWQRLIIMLGGVTVNLVLGFLIYMMIMFVWGKNYVGPDEMPEGFAIAEEFKQYGFEDGDRVLQINGEDLQNSDDVNRYLFMRDVNSITVLHQNGEEEGGARQDHGHQDGREGADHRPYRQGQGQDDPGPDEDGQ